MSKSARLDLELELYGNNFFGATLDFIFITKDLPPQNTRRKRALLTFGQLDILSEFNGFLLPGTS